jgi:hypothetical protein
VSSLIGCPSSCTFCRTGVTQSSGLPPQPRYWWVVGPELVRPIPRLLAIWLVPLAALGGIVLAAALPSAASPPPIYLRVLSFFSNHTRGCWRRALLRAADVYRLMQ